ncbi:MAG TPA: YciI family protein [Pseudolysinimonas sp.]|nr:YciI family protein [Pseudolysinimonas sp.]
MPKYMLIMRPQAGAELFANEIPFEEIINQVGAYNELLINAGVMVAGEGLVDAAQGVVIDNTGEKPIITDGPYGEVHELFNGFYILEVSSQEEAVEWALKMPLTKGSKTEIRRVSDESDFAEFADNEYIQKEKGWREQLGTN